MARRDWRRHLLRQGITPEQFVFQFVIVAVGVWLAIVVGDRTNRADLHEQANSTLRSVLHELQADRGEMNSALQLHQSNEKIVTRFINAAATPDTAVMGAFRGWLNTTFFPRRGAYTILETGGQLENIDDDSLRLHLAELYDHDYVRIYDDGKLLDEVNQAFRNAMTDFWNESTNRPTGMANSRALASSRAERFLTFSAFYDRLLVEDLAH